MLDGPLDIHVVLGIEKHRHQAEIQVKSRNGVFSGTQETGDLYASIGEVVDKLERQALKHKEKMLHSHKHRKGPRDPERRPRRSRPHLAPEEAAGGARTGDTPAEDLPQPALPPQATQCRGRGALELEGNGEDILVFRDVDTDRVNVVYRREGRQSRPDRTGSLDRRGGLTAPRSAW